MCTAIASRQSLNMGKKMSSFVFVGISKVRNEKTKSIEKVLLCFCKGSTFFMSPLLLRVEVFVIENSLRQNLYF